MKWKNLILLICIPFTLLSCDDGSQYLKSDMKFEKLGDCNSINPAVNVEANTIGERFVFEKCLESGFSGQYSAIRSNDTIKVEIPKKEGPSERFKITLDIQTRPEYNVLSIDGSFFPVRVRR